MDDHIRVVRHHPLAQREPVDRHRAQPMFFAQTFLQLIDDRFEVRLRRARADDKKVRETRDAAKIERDDILRFFVAGNIGDRLRELFGINGPAPCKDDVVR